MCAHLVFTDASPNEGAVIFAGATLAMTTLSVAALDTTEAILTYGPPLEDSCCPRQWMRWMRPLAIVVRCHPCFGSLIDTPDATSLTNTQARKYAQEQFNAISGKVLRKKWFPLAAVEVLLVFGFVVVVVCKRSTTDGSPEAAYIPLDV